MKRYADKERNTRRSDYQRAEKSWAKARPDQIAYANHLLSSWRHCEWFSGEPITVGQNFHLPVVRLAIRKTLENRP